MMSLLSRLLGGFGGRDGGGASEPPKGAPETHEGFTITPTPVKESTGYRIGATIEKDGKTHHLIRADTISDWEQAQHMSLLKAKQVIDQQGDGIFQ